MGEKSTRGADEFERILYNAIIYGLGMVLSKYDAFSAETMVKDLGRYIKEYLESENIKIPSGETPEETQRSIVQLFADKGFVKELRLQEKGEGRFYTKWKGLLGIEAYHRLFSETENPFISCPLNAVLLNALEDQGRTLRIRDLRFDLAEKTAETVEELMPKKKDEEIEVSNPVILENIRLYELARQRATELERERKNLDNIISALGADIFLLDGDFRITWANQKMIEKFGNVGGRFCYKTYCGVDEPSENCPAKEVFEKKKTVQRELSHAIKNRGEIHCQHVCSPITDRKGRVTRVLELVIDITEKKNLETQLRVAKDYLESLVNNTADAIVSIDLDGNVVSWNKGAERMFGWKAKEVIGSKPPHIPSELVHELAWMKDLTLRGRQISDYETVRLHKDGRRIHVSTTVSPIRDPEGNIIGASGILRDITKRKQAEQQLMEYARQLEHSNKLKDLFSDIMRHDMLSPINVIRNISEATGQESKEELLRRLKLARKSAHRLEEMIDKASKFTRLNDIDELEFRKTDLNTLFRGAVRNFKPLIEKKKINLDYRVRGRCMADVNPVIEEVFANLMSNAIKYSPPGSRVVVDINGENGFWKVIVKDEGIGIPDEYKKSIFERFERGVRGSIKGSGLGLAIVKRIIKLHRGEVWVEDNPDGGSIFYLKIPKKAAPKSLPTRIK